MSPKRPRVAPKLNINISKYNYFIWWIVPRIQFVFEVNYLVYLCDKTIRSTLGRQTLQSWIRYKINKWEINSTHKNLLKGIDRLVHDGNSINFSNFIPHMKRRLTVNHPPVHDPRDYALAFFVHFQRNSLQKTTLIFIFYPLLTWPYSNNRNCTKSASCTADFRHVSL